MGVGVRAAVGRGEVDFFGLGEAVGDDLVERFREALEEVELFDFFLGGGVLVRKSFTLPKKPSSAARASIASPQVNASITKIESSLLIECAE
ncbi:MAG TPA: hypothetical protein VJ719_01310 [Chthoniobacterales bacterium]|nr:hypothetical protein [Chthoniobacterales bacterium]